MYAQYSYVNRPARSNQVTYKLYLIIHNFIAIAIWVATIKTNHILDA